MFNDFVDLIVLLVLFFGDLFWDVEYEIKIMYFL